MQPCYGTQGTSSTESLSSKASAIDFSPACISATEGALKHLYYRSGSSGTAIAWPRVVGYAFLLPFSFQPPLFLAFLLSFACAGLATQVVKGLLELSSIVVSGVAVPLVVTKPDVVPTGSPGAESEPAAQSLVIGEDVLRTGRANSVTGDAESR
jgi:hypothetical protein